MPHALDRKRGFRVRSEFTFLDFIEVAQPASPLRWLADLILGLVGARSNNQERCPKVSRQAARIQQHPCAERYSQPGSGEPRGSLETEIRKLLHEVSRIAEQALARAKRVREEGAPAVEAELRRLDSLEQEVRWDSARQESELEPRKRLQVPPTTRSPRARRAANHASLRRNLDVPLNTVSWEHYLDHGHDCSGRTIAQTHNPVEKIKTIRTPADLPAERSLRQTALLRSGRNWATGCVQNQARISARENPDPPCGPNGPPPAQRVPP